MISSSAGVAFSTRACSCSFGFIFYLLIFLW
nr:MAG TPA: hypothetical protein [Caudoviricetes sp.]